jgi:hypothetical protein
VFCASSIFFCSAKAAATFISAAFFVSVEDATMFAMVTTSVVVDVVYCAPKDNFYSISCALCEFIGFGVNTATVAKKAKTHRETKNSKSFLLKKLFIIKIIPQSLFSAIPRPCFIHRYRSSKH